MKKLTLFIILAIITAALQAQHYPDPEFTNEVYFLQKGDSTRTIRLEKGASKMDTKLKMGGFGGVENGYILEGERSAVRIPSGAGLSFIFYTGASQGNPNPAADSVMRANGMDPAMMDEMMNSRSDPGNNITLYKTETGKGVRKVLLQKSPGMFGGKKISSSDKYTFSVKKIRAGYWELVIDKSLPRGEYTFSMMETSSANMDGSVRLFAFGAD
jgi:hypothetical protein